jgi:hypothetical protein
MGERLSSGADRVQGIALGPATPRRPLGPADLHHPLAAALQEGGQPSAVAASTLHRPTAPTRNLHLGEVQKATVAGRIRPYRGLGKQAAHRVGGGRGKGVAVGGRRRSRRQWCRPACSSPRLLSMVLCRWLVVSAWRTPRGASVTGHNRRVGLAAHQASKAVGQVDAGTTADSSSPRQPGWAPEPFWVMPECRTPKPDSDPPWTAPEDSQKTHRTVRLHWWRTDRNARLAWQRLRSFYVCQLWEVLESAGVRWPRRRLATCRVRGSCCWDGGRGRVPGPAGGRGPAG